MTKKLEQLRDELAHKFYDLDPKPDFPMRETQFAAGFDAAVRLMLEREKVLREALEFYANQDNWSYTTYDVCQTITPDDLSVVPSRSAAFGKRTVNGYVYDCGGETAREALSAVPEWKD